MKLYVQTDVSFFPFEVIINKMFALTGLEGDPPYVNLKYDPQRTIELQEQYEDIQSDYHMNKVIWEFFYTSRSSKHARLPLKVTSAHYIAYHNL
jgi:predicted DNA-binding protein (MmcQ/YjbR family)